MHLPCIEGASRIFSSSRFPLQVTMRVFPTITFTYSGGKSEFFKEKVEFDDGNLTFTLNGVEGQVFDLYKVYNPICKLVPKSKGCVAKLTIEYERLNEDALIPNHYMDFFAGLIKEVDAHAYATSA